ncbi:hypothetical protein AC249_AIPGENE11185 [Exaiptasia diaphana]|nr:hypothetical protein AC249_AIPGENE11185 [Exaiptasia diaphana]
MLVFIALMVSIDSQCDFTTRVRKESVTGSYLGTLSGRTYCGSNVKGSARYINCPRLTPSVRLNANERYILELTVHSHNGLLMKLVDKYGYKGGPFTATLPDGSRSITYTYETVSPAELTDSTGTTVDTGGIYGIIAQYAVD